MSDNQIILASLKEHLIQNYGQSVVEVILFGSRTHGNPDKSSDYDVLIVLDHNYTGKDENKILDLCYDIDLKYDILLDVHLISKNEIDSVRGRQPIFINALKSGLYA